MMKKNRFFDKFIVALVELIVYFYIMIFFRVESVWILIITVILLGVIFYLSKKFKKTFELINDSFTKNSKFATFLIVILMIAFPFVSKLIVPLYIYWLLITIQTFIFAIVALGLNFQAGTTGVMNLSSAAFYGVGAYTAGYLALHYKLPAILTIPLGGIAASIFGLLLFIPIFRARGQYFALITLAFGYMFVLSLNNLNFVGGPQGLKNIPPINLFGYNFQKAPFGTHFYVNYYYLVLIILLIALLIFHRLYNSWIGLTLNYIRDDEPAAKGCGVSTNKWKLMTLLIGNFFMGIGGAIYAHMIGFISPPNFTLTISLLIISIVLLGGSDNIIGVLVGAFILVLIPEKLRVITEYRVMLYGLLIVLILIFRPKGLIPFKERIYDKVIAKEN